jgi:hypothetical protein
LNLSFQSSRSYALPNIKVLKDKDLEFANSIRPLNRHALRSPILAPDPVQQLSPSINVELVVGLEVFRQHIDRIASQPPLGFPIATAQFYTLSRISFVHKPLETV